MSQITYEELGQFIANMTPAQRKHPVKFYNNETDEIQPLDETNHPEYSCSSKIVLVKELYEHCYDYEDEYHKDQYVIVQYLDEEADRQLQILRWKEILLLEDLGYEQKQHCEKMISLLTEGKDLKEIISIHMMTVPDPDPIQTWLNSKLEE